MRGCFSSYGVGALHRIKGIMKNENFKMEWLYSNPNPNPLLSSTITTQNTHQMLLRIISRTKESKSFLTHLKAQIWTLLRICGPRLIDIFRNGNATAKKICSRVWRRNGSISMKKLSPNACGKHAKPVAEVLKSRGCSINYYGVAWLYSAVQLEANNSVLIAPEVTKTSDI